MRFSEHGAQFYTIRAFLQVFKGRVYIL